MSNAEYNMERVLSRDEFKNYLYDNIKNSLPESYADADIAFEKIRKQGGADYEALLVRLDKEQATPAIPIDGVYEKYVNGKIRPEDAVKEIVAFRMGCPDDIGINSTDITDFDKVKKRVFPKLISAENSREYLKDKVHTMFNDMAVIYVIDLGNASGRGYMGVTLTNSLLEAYDISRDELHEQAVSNLSDKEPDIQSISDMFGGMFLADDTMETRVDQTIYVVTNKEKRNGANMLLNEKAMNELAEKMGGDFVIIPSSIHECIAVPAWMNGVLPINSMICEVNESTVDVSEWLSDHVYMYDADEHKLMMPQEYELIHSFDAEVITSDIWEKFKRGASRHELNPDGGSFHGEAFVYEANGIKVLESFDMPVAISINDRVKLIDDNTLSRNATRHVLEFANQEMGFDNNREISDIPVSQSRAVQDKEEKSHTVTGMNSGIDWFEQDLGMAR